MTHEPHKARRIGKSAVPHERLPQHPQAHKGLLLGALVAGTALLIAGVYASTMRYQSVFNQTVDDFPRWTALTDGIIEQAHPVLTQVDRLKAAVTAVTDAKKTQLAAAELLKRKLEARSATATPETP